MPGDGIQERQGISITFGTLVVTLNLLDVSQDGVSVTDINTSDQGTTGYETYVASTLIEGGTYTWTVNWNLKDQAALMAGIGSDDTMTITYPKTLTAASTDVIPCYINNIQKSGAKGDLVKGTIAFKVRATPTFTDEA